jgi:GT2 family glycosyltransferase
MTTAERPATVAVTVSLVTFNGMRWLPGCLASLTAQDLSDYELLVLDNASTDGSLDVLRSHVATDGRARLEASPENLGFAKAHNRNIGQARGEYVLLLNQDVELDPGFLREAVAAFSRSPRMGSVQGRLRRLGPNAEHTETLDTTGLEMQRDRRFVSRSQGETDGPGHHVAGPVFGADGPAPVYRHAALMDARLPASTGGWEVLDEDFFMYKEDVDLAWRLRLLGWTAWYAPDALAWHARGAGGPRAVSLLDIARTNRTIPRWIKVLSWRNQRLMQVKNDSLADYLRNLPWIVRREVLSLGFILVADPTRLRAVPSLLQLLPSALRKRRHLAARRQKGSSAGC